MKRKYIIGIIVLIATLCLGLTMCGIKNWLQRSDKDELKDSEYVTGSSDKFDDTDADTNLPFDDSEEGNASPDAGDSKESNADKMTDSVNSTTNDADDKKTENSDGNSNSTEEDKQPESEKEDNKEDSKEEDEKEEVNKEDEGWTGFY